MQSSLYLPKFDRIKDFDSSLLSYPERPPIYSHIENMKQEIVGPTKDFEMVTQIEKYSTRSIKILADALGISFEEKFLDEHKDSFKNQLQKYMEHQQNYFGALNQHTLSGKIFLPTENSQDFFQLNRTIRDNCPLLSEIQAQMLVIDLRREDKFSEFLEQVLKKLNVNVQSEFIFLANQLWEEFALVQQMNYTFEEMVQFAENFTNKSLERFDEKLSLLNYKYVEKLAKSNQTPTSVKQRLSQFKRFVTFFTTTLALVIGGYFQNPYTCRQQNYYKRELNQLGLCFQNEDQYRDKDLDSEQQGDIIKSKRIKF